MMPSKPKRPCSYPGCPKLTDGRFCEEHAKVEARRYEKYDRDPAVRRRYGRAWKRIRDSYVQQHPLCEMCQKEGRLVMTEEVHHKIPLSEGGTHARENLIAFASRAMPESMPSVVTAGITADPVGAGQISTAYRRWNGRGVACAKSHKFSGE